jgi:ABC-type sugar transport system, periplasmic component
MRTTKLILSLFLLGTLIVGTAGIGLAQTTVTVAYWPGPESEAMQKVVDWWNANRAQETGIQVRLLTFSRQDFFTRQLVALAAGSTEFDIAFTTTYIVGETAPYLEPLDEYFASSATGDLSVYIPSTLESLTFDGRLYGIPTDVSNHFLYYRTDLIDELLSNQAWQERYAEITERYLGKALAPRPPEEWTPEDYVGVSLFFTRRINPQSPTAYGTVLQLRNLIFNVMLWNNMLRAYGGQWIVDGEPALTSEAAQKALEAYMIIIRNGATPPDSLNYEFPEANAAMGSGQVATAIHWSAGYQFLTDPNSYPLVYDKIAIAPVPGKVTWVHSLGLGLNAASPRKQEAFEFLAFLASEQAMQMYAENGGLPPVASVLESLADRRPEFVSVAEHVDKYGYVESTRPETQAILQALADNLSAAWSGQVDPVAALEQAQKDVVNILSR